MSAGEAFIIGPGGKSERLIGIRGVTPPCPQAKFQPQDVVRLRRRKHLKALPEIGAVVVVIPPGFSPDWAMADLWKVPRPLMAQIGARNVTYIVGFEDNPKPYLLHERDLLPTGEKSAPVKLVGSAEER